MARDKGLGWPGRSAGAVERPVDVKISLPAGPRTEPADPAPTQATPAPQPDGQPCRKPPCLAA
ncbi:MAG: hypothetical protein ACRDZO_03615 [Egibacteraceae bacterium]